MEPRIQYAKTADGVSIAFWTLGEGTPLVYMPAGPWSHIQLEWQFPATRSWHERLSRNRMLVRYDGRGSGLSDREVADYSLDALVVDLEAVVARLGLQTFALFGEVLSGLAAVAYAAHNPERVSHLLLWCSFPRGSDFWRSTRTQAFRALREADWELYAQSFADSVTGTRADEETARLMGEFIREAVTPETLRAASQAIESADVTDLLPQVRSPTLVLHRREVATVAVELARGLASRIPDARLVVLEGASMLPFLENAEAVARAVDEFLDEREEAPAGREARAPGGLVTVLFTDIEGSGSLTERLGDARARDVLRTHERITREALTAHGGSEVKTMGDGFMASFPSATRALECAIAMQRAFAEQNESVLRQSQDEHTEPVEVRVRIGLNAGEPIAEEEDLFGTAVIVAARIAAKAEGGEILAANVVRELAAGKGFLFSDRGDVVLRGFEDPVRLYEVRWREPADGG